MLVSPRPREHQGLPLSRGDGGGAVIARKPQHRLCPPSTKPCPTGTSHFHLHRGLPSCGQGTSRTQGRGRPGVISQPWAATHPACSCAQGPQLPATASQPLIGGGGDRKRFSKLPGQLPQLFARVNICAGFASGGCCVGPTIYCSTQPHSKQKAQPFSKGKAPRSPYPKLPGQFPHA